MKIKRILGFLSCLLAVIIAFSNLSITGNVIGQTIIDGMNGFLVIIFLLVGLGMLMVEDLEGRVKMVNIEALRNAKQGVPRGEYRADIGVFKNQGDVELLPVGTFHADIGKNLLGENEYATYRNKQGKLMRVYVRAYEGPEVCKAIGKDMEEHTDFRKGIEHIGPPDFHVHVVTSYDQTPDILAAEYSVSAATLRPMNNAILPREIKEILEKVDRNLLYDRAKRVFYDLQARKEPWYGEDKGPVKR